jgi:hypothetical protein
MFFTLCLKFNQSICKTFIYHTHNIEQKQKMHKNLLH